MGAVTPVGLAAIFVIFSGRYSPRDKYWAYGALGALIGFFLRPPRS